jgi:hypothetical protein
MRVLDEAVAAALERVFEGARFPDKNKRLVAVQVNYGSADRDDPPPYIIHRSTDSRPAGGNGFGAEGREYEHSIVAVAMDPDTAEAMREAVIAAFRGATLDVPGWGTSQKITWQGEVHDPGDLLPGGSIGYEAGDRYRITISRTL